MLFVSWFEDLTSYKQSKKKKFDVCFWFEDLWAFKSAIIKLFVLASLFTDLFTAVYMSLFISVYVLYKDVLKTWFSLFKVGNKERI